MICERDNLPEETDFTAMSTTIPIRMMITALMINASASVRACSTMHSASKTMRVAKGLLGHDAAVNTAEDDKWHKQSRYRPDGFAPGIPNPGVNISMLTNIMPKTRHKTAHVLISLNMASPPNINTSFLYSIIG
mgnify:CR=1 FL=1